MFANKGKIIKKPLICLRKRKNRIFIHSDDSRHVETIALLEKYFINKAYNLNIMSLFLYLYCNYFNHDTILLMVY